MKSVKGGANPCIDCIGSFRFIEYHARRLPGPADYSGEIIRAPPIRGGHFSSSHPKSELDWIEYRESQTPGAADYLPRVPMSKGCRINRSFSGRPAHELQLRQGVEKEPGPGHYDTIY